MSLGYALELRDRAERTWSMIDDLRASLRRYYPDAEPDATRALRAFDNIVAQLEGEIVELRRTDYD